MEIMYLLGNVLPHVIYSSEMAFLYSLDLSAKSEKSS